MERHLSTGVAVFAGLFRAHAAPGEAVAEQEAAHLRRVVQALRDQVSMSTNDRPASSAT